MKNEIDDLSPLADAVSGRALDEWLGLLANREMQITLAYLYDHPKTTVNELATAIAGKTAAEEGRIAAESDYDDAYIYLYHSILPRLDDHELLEFDAEEQTVRDVDVPPAIYTVLGIGE
ncbi:uncharacterized protein Nmag_1969 [Natrialba magadii ATCC 43099]|uniref:DUF7344 domain-containing protein n=1 Tax=Natrialba magadii (strain ATCC 43099 / DSM 3394 / CCM 3739 / CIP 104546 / IAM 13178 / JCM 8861 / NBRC 102185 / NCIMB 2190 / MS3) TaxID=547559 RepID=D3SVD2_NATMM|nr:hypothetical protein [Natrialba magadii]ADD05540.1 uncharacterized protein Nmag_1969 [Natrialba magadii ATCC 43099]ELY29498.1 hypothetical protein C500_10553 [Natrialba magadii ATCC 43099]